MSFEIQGSSAYSFLILKFLSIPLNCIRRDLQCNVK